MSAEFRDAVKRLQARLWDRAVPLAQAAPAKAAEPAAAPAAKPEEKAEGAEEAKEGPIDATAGANGNGFLTNTTKPLTDFSLP